jgi:hypothetical protein
MSCHFYRPCGHPWVALCGCDEIDQVADEICALLGQDKTRARGELKQLLVRIWKHGAELQRSTDRILVKAGREI